MKLVCGILCAAQERAVQARQDLLEEFGPLDYCSDFMDFKFTDYYCKEMGSPLYRQFVSFERLVDPAKLAEIKVRTNALEERYVQDGRRMVNLDPGYLNSTAYVLATSKNYAHRIYLGSGVFAQQELLFERKRIRTLDWTYPDYRSVQYHEIFKLLRTKYLNQLTSSPNGPDQAASAGFGTRKHGDTEE